jgi:hypothetical protein
MVPESYTIDKRQCKYLPHEELPVMVLAVKSNYYFKDKGKFQAIAHQTAGHACHQHYMLGRILQPRLKTLKAMNKINKYWFYSDCGAGTPSLDEVNEYRRQLKELLDVDCNYSYPDFEEGIYPIDFSIQTIRKLCSDKLPDRLESQIHFKSKTEKILGSIINWNLCILGDNCD